MPRILLTVSYDGTAYSGWQRQINGESIQACLEDALSRATGETIRVTGASRTDAGVHALGQKCHFDTLSRIPADKFPFVLQPLLPPDIRVTQGMAVADGFHARFLSCRKKYTYRFLNCRFPDAMHRLYHLHVPRKLQDTEMTRALADLLGTHDFAAFQAAGGTAKSTVRTIYRADLTRDGDCLTLFLEGNAFLYNMVRIIAGTLVEIGEGRRSPEAFREALETGSRLALGPTAPPHGLELTDVLYPPDAYLHPEFHRWHEEAEESLK
ncbi:MAG: tRNA pseudouridine(38-40) synthase TruA [Clostridia bacterium]|nr:tRNA pseudouridine(38-40) synthase TruA [Clostridia bacterium]